MGCQQAVCHTLASGESVTSCSVTTPSGRTLDCLCHFIETGECFCTID